MALTDTTVPGATEASVARGVFTVTRRLVGADGGPYATM